MTKIIYVKGDMFDGNDYYLAHGCNNKGVMGSGVAKQIRERYPMAYDFYRWNYTEFRLEMGQCYPMRCPDPKSTDTGGHRMIINAITQNGYGRDGKVYVDYVAIVNCVENINNIAGSSTVGMPMIGAGLGGGDWRVISAIIEKYSTFQPVVYEL